MNKVMANEGDGLIAYCVQIGHCGLQKFQTSAQFLERARQYLSNHPDANPRFLTDKLDSLYLDPESIEQADDVLAAMGMVPVFGTYNTRVKVVLRQGGNSKVEKYVLAQRQKVQQFLDRFQFGEGIPSFADMLAITGNVREKIPSDKIHFVKPDLGSVVFDCEKEETANTCARHFDFGDIFVNGDGRYRIRNYLVSNKNC